MATSRNDGNGTTFLGPGRYHIRVQGRLDVSWSDRLSGLTVITSGGGGAPDSTVLEGLLPDQTALAGVLNTIYELQLPVLNVERLQDEDTDSHD